MNRQKLGKVIFWVGVVYLIGANFTLSWFVTPYTKYNSPEQLSSTVWATDGLLFWFWVTAGPVGATIALVGLLLLAQKKGPPLVWLLGVLATLVNMLLFGPYRPESHNPVFFGVGGGIIAVSFLGILWSWGRTHAILEGRAKTGAYFKLFGYFFLMMASYHACGYFSGTHLAAFRYEPFGSPESILLPLSLGWLLIGIGHYTVARATGRMSDSDSKS
jgi:hypothetical protein